VNATGEPLSAAQEAELDFAGQLSGSSTHKARLLHYFPVQHDQQQQQQQMSDEDWCGWHLDHGSLTGKHGGGDAWGDTGGGGGPGFVGVAWCSRLPFFRLCKFDSLHVGRSAMTSGSTFAGISASQLGFAFARSAAHPCDALLLSPPPRSLRASLPTGLTCAMYIKDGKPVPTPDPQAGLYICNRAGQVVQASIPPEHIAFQLGQVLSIQSGGLLRATPHYVRAAAAGPGGISRNTFAVFMQPELDVVLNSPKGLEALGGLLCMDSGHWSPGGFWVAEGLGGADTGGAGWLAVHGQWMKGTGWFVLMGSRQAG
jgi:hypothetical protein